MWMESLYGVRAMKSSWRVGQQFLFLVNGSSCWPTGQPIGQWVDLFTKSNPLANGLTCWPRTPTRWPTPYNWRVGYNSSPAKRPVERHRGHPAVARSTNIYKQKFMENSDTLY